jgi:hypothetical protein
MIYCVVPEELADELLPRLSSYYEDDPHVEVIVDRRRSQRRGRGDRRQGARGDQAHEAETARREQRDRRRARVAGDFPRVDPVQSA